jgi:Zn-dependent metalloprotease
MKSKIIFLLALISASFQVSTGQIKPETSQLSAIHVLNAKYKNNIEISWNKTNGSPETITIYNPVSFDNDHEKAANKFINDFKNLLKCRYNEDSLVIIGRDENKGIKYFRYRQKYKDIPVYGGEYVVKVLKDGSIHTALGSFYKDISINIKPNITASEALQSAIKNPRKGIKLKESFVSSELLIFPMNDLFYLAYELHIRTAHDGETWCYIINASNGDVLSAYSDIVR